jgi:hypothetical protein
LTTVAPSGLHQSGGQIDRWGLNFVGSTSFSILERTLDFCLEMMASEICGSGIYAEEDEGLRRRGIFSECWERWLLLLDKGS